MIRFKPNISTCKPSKLRNISRDQQIDAALSVAWSSIVEGSWQVPLVYAKAKVLDCEFEHYKTKYLHEEVLSEEIIKFQLEVNKILEVLYDLQEIIKKDFHFQNSNF